MFQKNQKGRAIFGVIAAIAIIALVCFLIVYFCQTGSASRKAKEIAEDIAVRTRLYCPQIPIDRPQSKEKTYTQNGPYGVTIILQSEEETLQPEGMWGTFSVVVDLSNSKALCQKLIKTDIFKPDFITVDGKKDGKCPGVIRFYFTCPYQLDEMPVVVEQDEEDSYLTQTQEEDFPPHFTFTPPAQNSNTARCKEPTPYEDKHGKCVACLTASQCEEDQDCVNNDCQPCPDFSSRVVRVGQRIGTRHCYCNEGYQLNSDQNGCIARTNDWDTTQYCVGNRCTVCPKNADKNSGIRIGTTDCYCNDGYLPRQVSATQWRCSKVEILYPEQENQIIIHDEKYSVPQSVPASTQTDVLDRPEQIQQVPNRVGYPIPQPLQSQDLEDLFEPAFIPEPIFLQFPNDGYFDIQAWESLEITVQ